MKKRGGKEMYWDPPRSSYPSIYRREGTPPSQQTQTRGHKSSTVHLFEMSVCLFVPDGFFFFDSIEWRLFQKIPFD